MKRRKMDTAKKVNDEQFRIDHQRNLDDENWDQIIGQPIDLKDCQERSVELSFREYFSKDVELIKEMALKKLYSIFQRNAK